MLTGQHVTATDSDVPSALPSSLTYRPVTFQPNEGQALLLSSHMVSGFRQIFTGITGIYYFPQKCRQSAHPSA